MKKPTIIHEIAAKGSDKEKIAGQVIQAPEWLEEIFEGLHSGKARIQYGCEKTLRIISGKRPEVLYPQFDLFAQMLEGKNSFLKWGSILTISNLACVDTENKFEKIFDKYFSPVLGPDLVTAANVITGAPKIALAKPRLTGEITKEILKVEKAKYKTAECRNVAIGRAIDSLDQFFHQIKERGPVIKFIKRQLKNSRKTVKKKAERFLKKYKTQL